MQPLELNLPTIIVALLLIALCIIAVRRLRKYGACGCSDSKECADYKNCSAAGGCAACPLNSREQCYHKQRQRRS